MQLNLPTTCRGTDFFFSQASELLVIQKQPLLKLLMIFSQLQTVDLCLRLLPVILLVVASPYRDWGMSLGLKGDFWAASNCIYALNFIVMLLIVS